MMGRRNAAWRTTGDRLVKVVLCVTVLVGLAYILARPAPGQTPPLPLGPAILYFPALCGEPGSAAETLHDKYGEHLFWQGVTAQGDLLQLYSDDRGEWTAVYTPAGKNACAFLPGTDGHLVVPEPDKPDT